jgi:hypothetical protein
MPKAKTLADKLLLKPGETAKVINAPKDAPSLPTGEPAKAVIVFAARAKDLARVPKSVPAAARLWVCYPKAGKLDTDLSRDKLWPLMQEKGWEGVRLVALDDTWSAMAFRRENG